MEILLSVHFLLSCERQSFRNLDYILISTICYFLSVQLFSSISSAMCKCFCQETIIAVIDCWYFILLKRIIHLFRWSIYCCNLLTLTDDIMVHIRYAHSCNLHRQLWYFKQHINIFPILKKISYVKISTKIDCSTNIENEKNNMQHSN